MKKTMIIVCVDKRDGVNSYTSTSGSTEEYDLYFVSNASQLKHFADKKCEIVVTERYAKNGISQEMRKLITSISDAPLVDRFVFVSMPSLEDDNTTLLRPVL